ncbi:hypothetical protein HDU76_004851 [Blyttiomyces sp. JEL0837]|nr:hypothetical protein HDU76_004851 [Blyttiomyces sp. JEL0837]
MKDDDIIASVLKNDCLYARLGVRRDACTQEIRRGYLSRSKVCHPDRLRNHPQAKEAFQRLSSAYQTLSEPQSRQAYDLYGRQVDGNEQTFVDAISQVFSEFLAGQFDTLIRIVDYVQTLNPDVKISKEQARQIFGSMREFFLWSGDCWGAAKFEVIQLYEMQQDLRCLSYFDIAGRWRTAGQLSSGILALMGRVLSVKDS